MSRLSRFKKAPAVKLPKKLDKGRFQEDDSDDDDFKSPLVRLEIKPKPKLTEKIENATSSQSHSQPKQAEVGSSNNSSFSEYFLLPTKEPENLNKKVSQVPVLPIKEKPETSKKVTCKQSRGSSKSKSKDEEEEEISAPPPPNENNGEEDVSTVFCPFCWKKLADKLTGTTHIKSCAKDLPIEQIHEAMLLQEKQIQEWKQLGLNFPAFTDNKRTKKAVAQPRGRGGRGKKKNEDGGGVDPQLELAMALSVSLHEELEGRKQNENRFLIENGLDQEIGLAKVSSSHIPSTSSTMKLEKSTKPSSSEIMPMPSKTTTTTSRRRGKKAILETLPLYTTSDSQKKAIIADRVANILNQSMSQEKADFYIRDPLPADVFSVPKRLQPLHNKACTLWNRAKCSPDTKADAFKVLELDVSRSTQVLETEDVESSENKESETDSSESIATHRKSSEKIIENEGFSSAGYCTEEPEVAQLSNANSLSKSSGVEVKRTAAVITSRKPARSSVTSRSSVSNFDKKAFKHLSPVVQDVARMLFDGVDCDITICGREEKPIKCHRFMLAARCPQILREIVVEERPGLPNRNIIPLTSLTHETIKAFIWYLYTGTVDSEKESLLQNLRDLGSVYGIQVAAEDNRIDNEPRFKRDKPTLLEAEVQTDATCTKDSCSMTEAIDFTDKRESMTKENTCPDLDDNIVSQELFTTFCLEDSFDADPQIDHHSPTISKPDNKVDENSTQSSVDLFEDIENEMKTSKEDSNAAGAVDLETSNHFNMEGEHLESPIRDDYYNNDDDDYLLDLNSPVISSSQTSCEKKRSRSVSPLIDTSLYSATQVANILQSHQDGGENVSEFRKKSKKPKLDSIFDRSIEIDVVENNCITSDVERDDNRKSVKSNKSTFDNIVPIQNTITTPKTKTKSRLSRRSISTPNLLTPIANSHYSPFHAQQGQVNCNEDYDPLEDACDDSMFANIPDDVFLCANNTKPKTPWNIYESKPQTQNKGKKQNSAPSCLISSTPPSRSSQRHLLSKYHSSQLSNDDSIPISQKETKKARGKEKPKPKMKLPKNLPPVQEESLSATQSYSSPTTTKAKPTRSKNGNPTPLLNYSLIDTPILKQELKKYGIKPLPRSKAKVLLRHIYKETHK